MTIRTARRMLAPLLAAALALGLAGCADSTGGSGGVTVDHTTRQVLLSPGEELIVDFGEINATVGDEWEIVSEPDPAVLGPGEPRSEYLGEDDEDGAPNLFAYRFAPVGEGTTVIEFEYRFRGAVPENANDRETARIEVTVE